MGIGNLKMYPLVKVWNTVAQSYPGRPSRLPQHLHSLPFIFWFTLLYCKDRESAWKDPFYWAGCCNLRRNTEGQLPPIGKVNSSEEGSLFCFQVHQSVKARSAGGWGSWSYYSHRQQAESNGCSHTTRATDAHTQLEQWCSRTTTCLLFSAVQFQQWCFHLT